MAERHNMKRRDQPATPPHPAKFQRQAGSQRQHLIYRPEPDKCLLTEEDERRLYNISREVEAILKSKMEQPQPEPPQENKGEDEEEDLGSTNESQDDTLTQSYKDEVGDYAPIDSAEEEALYRCCGWPAVSDSDK